MSSSIVVHRPRRHRRRGAACRSCEGTGFNFSSPVWRDDIIVDFAPCHCTRTAR